MSDLDWGDEEVMAALRAQARLVAREEVASLCGLMLRRLQDEGPTRSFERNAFVDMLQELWGEGLRDFGGTTQEPGSA